MKKLLAFLLLYSINSFADFDFNVGDYLTCDEGKWAMQKRDDAFVRDGSDHISLFGESDLPMGTYRIEEETPDAIYLSYFSERSTYDVMSQTVSYQRILVSAIIDKKDVSITATSLEYGKTKPEIYYSECKVF